VLDIGDAIVFSMLSATQMTSRGDDVPPRQRGDPGDDRGATIEGRRPDGTPHWAMYDTFWGATKGLAYFKERVGFRQYTVDWVWVDRDAGRPSATGLGTP
jgi:hypothetical protein